MRLVLVITLSFIIPGVLAQDATKPASGSLSEFNAAIAIVMKTPVIISLKGKKTESFCKRPDTLNEAELKKLQLACEKIFTDTATPDFQKAAARYILGKTKTQYPGRDIATRYCNEALPLLSLVADFYDQNSIPGNGPHEAMASCLIETQRPEPALAWIDRGLKRKVSSQMHYLSGLAWQQLDEWEVARTAFEKSIALDKNNEAAIKALTQLESQASQNKLSQPDQTVITDNSASCQSWKAAITDNRRTCDTFLDDAFDDFFACMDDGMTASGYGPRSDEQTQVLYQACGLSSWTDESLKP